MEIGLHKRYNGLNGLHTILKILIEPNKSMADKLSSAVELIPSFFLYPEYTSAEIQVENKNYRTSAFQKSSNQLLHPLIINGKEMGHIAVYVCKESPVPQDFFSEEEKVLFNTISNDLIQAMEMEAKQSMLSQLSLIAEETINLVLITDVTGKIQWVNRAFEASTGYTLKEARGKSPSEFLHGPKTNEEIKAYIELCINQQKPFSCELIKYKKDGTTYWVSIEGQPIKDEHNEVFNFFQIETDITEKKKLIEENKKVEQNASRFAVELNKMLEKERAHWAREIHDEFGQQLSGIKMSLSTLHRINLEPNASKKIISETVHSLEAATKSLKSISTQLRPGILDTLGIADSINWLANQFESKSGITVNKKIIGQPIELKELISITLFRICQEALNNIAKHANASKVDIYFEITESDILLEVNDDGVGIEEEELGNPFALGLLGMRERARLAGATLKITSVKGQFTRVKLQQPLNGTEQDTYR